MSADQVQIPRTAVSRYFDTFTCDPTCEWVTLYDLGDGFTDAFDLHTNLKQNPFHGGEFYTANKAYLATAKGLPNKYDIKVTFNNKDWITRGPPICPAGYAAEDTLKPFKVAYPAWEEPFLKSLKQTWNNADMVLGFDDYAEEKRRVDEERASLSAIFGRVVSAREMLKAGWRARGSPVDGLKVRYTIIDDFESSRHILTDSTALYVPDDWSNEMTAALVSLAVNGGPGAYRWYNQANNMQSNLNVMPAGAGVFWPGGTNNVVLVTSRPRSWPQAFGGEALNSSIVGELVSRMRGAYGLASFIDATMLTAAVNRVYHPPNYEFSDDKRVLSIAKPARGVYLPTDDRWDNNLPARGDRYTENNPGTTYSRKDSYAIPINTDAAIRKYGQILWNFVDSHQELELAGQLPNLYDATIDTIHCVDNSLILAAKGANGDGIQMRRTRTISCLSWPFPPQSRRIMRAYRVLRAMLCPGFARAVPHFAEIGDDSVANHRLHMERNIYGMPRRAAPMRLPSLAMDGWYTALLGISVPVDRVTDPFNINCDEQLISGLAATMHLLVHRELFDTDFEMGSIDRVDAAQLFRRLPFAYRPGFYPSFFDNGTYPYGSLECLESAAILGGSNKTPYVGFDVEGTWEVSRESPKTIFMKDTGRMDEDFEDPDAAFQRRKSRRALDAAVRACATAGIELRLQEPATKQMALMSDGHHHIHPFGFRATSNYSWQDRLVLNSNELAHLAKGKVLSSSKSASAKREIHKIPGL